MVWYPEELDFRNIVGMDPAANWLLGANAERFVADAAQTLIPITIASQDENFIEIFHDLEQLAADQPDLKFLPVRYKDGSKSRPVKGVDFVLVNLNLLVKTARSDSGPMSDFRASPKAVILSQPSPMITEALTALPDPDPPFEPPDGGWRDDTVIMGVVDDGIAFANVRFQLPDRKTRIYSFWNMDVPISDQPELFKSEIDNVLLPLMEEDSIYKAAGLIDHRQLRHKTAAWRKAHGTHVLDLAAGYDPDVGVTNRPILAAQLPVSVVEDTLGQWLDFNLLLAIGNMMRRADQLRNNVSPDDMPMVINASFGYITGPHNGKKPIEIVLDWLTSLPNGPTFVLPAGNDHLSQCHAKIDFSAADVVEFDWIVQPDDMTASYFEVWLPESADPDNRLLLTLVDPSGGEHNIAETSGAVVQELDNALETLLLMEVITTFPVGQRMIRVSINPTSRFQPTSDPISPAGRWRLKFAKGEKEMGDTAHVWIQRDDSIYGYPQRGRQSYFEHPEYKRFDVQTFEIEDDEHDEQGPCPISRKCLINAIATGANVITAGGYLERECRVARYSAGGPTVPPETLPVLRRKPDVLLPSELSKAVAGVLAAGGSSGSVVAMSGTSVAAPQLARWIAKWLGEDVPIDRDKLEELIQDLDPCEPALDTDRVGWGKLPSGITRIVKR